MPQPQTNQAPTPHSNVILTQTPPVSIGAVLGRLGPGLIIAGSIVGSGELIATTKTGAEAGFTLLWLILIGCVIKVFVQVELGRYTITEGRATIDAMNEVPGPRLGVNWLVWYWLVMYLAGVGQLAGVIGGVGQSLAMTIPLTGDFIEHLESGAGAYTYDDIYWAAFVAVVTSVLLVNGRYGMIQRVATVLVASFTIITIFNVWALPRFADVTVGWNELKEGLSFRLPAARPGATSTPIATALATFGIIGVGASELVTYPYWCLEKGYARFTGPRDNSPGWAERARGWMRVMRWDAWCSMVIYTFATMAFYVLGASVLFPRGESPSGNQMIRTLALMYEDVFRPWGLYVFLFGAFAVLYSTLFVATAGNTRVAADGLRVFGLGAANEQTRRWWIRLLCAVLPFVYLGIYIISKDPVRLVLISGLTQSIMLPMLGGAALYFRYRHCDSRIRPGKAWDTFLWISVAGLLIAGTWGAGGQILALVRSLMSLGGG